MNTVKSHYLKSLPVENSLADRTEGYVEETLETAGCTGGCPIHPGAPKTEDGYPDCTKCPEFIDRNTVC